MQIVSLVLHGEPNSNDVIISDKDSEIDEAFVLASDVLARLEA